MSSLTLITGTIDEAEDPFHKLDINELYYEFWEEDIDNLHDVIVRREVLPIRFYGNDYFRIVQYLGSGKTLKAMDILTNKIFFGGKVAANLGLVWDNIDKKKNEWDSSITSMDDLESIDHCTVLIDDIKATISKWNAKEADMISAIANAGRKTGLDIIITAQREKFIPPEIRDMATEWIVPIIRVRDMTRETPDNTGYPIELISLHFDGTKIFKFMSEPLVNLQPLFDSYSTLQKALSLKEGQEKAKKMNQPGYDFEIVVLKRLQELRPDIEWKHLDKKIFDIIGDKYAFDACSVDDNGNPYTDHKMYGKHLATAGRKRQVPYIVFPYAGDLRAIRIKYDLPNRIDLSEINMGKRLQTLESILRKKEMLEENAS